MKGFLLLFPFLACFFLSAGADGFEGHILLKNEDLVLRGEVQLDAEAKYLGQIYPEAKACHEKILDLPLLIKPTVLLVRNQELFERLGGGPSISAFAVPSENLIVLHLSPVTSRSPVLNDVFKHELCHLLLHDHIRSQNIPKWLDEGICQWVSGTIGEFLAGDRVTISRIEMAYRLIPLRQLEVTFPKDKDLLLLAYKESHDFVGYVAFHYGVESIREILKYLKRGDHVDQAIMESLHKSFGEVQEEWIADMKSRSEWFIWASQNLYELLFTAAAVLTILAAVRLRLRRANYSDEDEE